VAYVGTAVRMLLGQTTTRPTSSGSRPFMQSILCVQQCTVKMWNVHYMLFRCKDIPTKVAKRQLSSTCKHYIGLLLQSVTFVVTSSSVDLYGT